jgi:hypothetical protein
MADFVNNERRYQASHRRYGRRDMEKLAALGCSISVAQVQLTKR